jgi:hypothetical protein
MLSQEALETQPIQRFVATPKPMAIQKDALYKEDAGQHSKIVTARLDLPRFDGHSDTRFVSVEALGQ